jgi:hypothetical protein
VIAQIDDDASAPLVYLLWVRAAQLSIFICDGGHDHALHSSRADTQIRPYAMINVVMCDAGAITAPLRHDHRCAS